MFDREKGTMQQRPAKFRKIERNFSKNPLLRFLSIFKWSFQLFFMILLVLFGLPMIRGLINSTSGLKHTRLDTKQKISLENNRWAGEGAKEMKLYFFHFARSICTTQRHWAINNEPAHVPSHASRLIHALFFLFLFSLSLPFPFAYFSPHCRCSPYIRRHQKTFFTAMTRAWQLPEKWPALPPHFF